MEKLCIFTAEYLSWIRLQEEDGMSNGDSKQVKDK